MSVKIEIDQVWRRNSSRVMFRITDIFNPNIFGYCKVMAVEIMGDVEGGHVHFVNVNTDGYTNDLDANRFTTWSLIIRPKTKTKTSKVIPGIPLDPTLHILEAGYIQDRQRKKYMAKTCLIKK